MNFNEVVKALKSIRNSLSTMSYSASDASYHARVSAEQSAYYVNSNDEYGLNSAKTHLRGVLNELTTLFAASAELQKSMTVLKTQLMELSSPMPPRDASPESPPPP